MHPYETKLHETASVVRPDLRRSVANGPGLGRRIAKEANGERTMFGGGMVMACSPRLVR